MLVGICWKVKVLHVENLVCNDKDLKDSWIKLQNAELNQMDTYIMSSFLHCIL